MPCLFTYHQHRRVYSWWFLLLSLVNRSTSRSEISLLSCFCYSTCGPQSPRMSLLLSEDKAISKQTKTPDSPRGSTFTIIISCMSSFMVPLNCHIIHHAFQFRHRRHSQGRMRHCFRSRGEEKEGDIYER